MFGTTFDGTSPNTGTTTQLSPRLGATTRAPLGDNQTWIYTGQFFDADGVFAFAENIDDHVQIKIDGNIVLSNNAWNVATATGTTVGIRTTSAPVDGTVAGANPNGGVTTFGMGPGGLGWHDIEIRMWNGTGGAGPSGQTGTTPDTGWISTAFGFGLNATSVPADARGSNYSAPVDPGNGTLFRTAAADIDPNAPTLVPTTLTKAGLGTLNLKSASPHQTTTVSAGTLALTGNGALPSAYQININAGGTIRADNTDTINSNRIGNNAAIAMTGGTLELVGNAGGGGVTENVDRITVNATDGLTNTIRSTTLGTGTNSLISTSLVRSAAGATINFVGVGDDLGTADNQIRFTGGTTPLVNGIIPYAIVNGPAGLDLVTDVDGNAATAPYSIGRVATYASDINTPNGVVKLTGAGGEVRNLTASNTIAGLLLSGGVTVSADAGVLTIGTGTTTANAGLIVNASGNNVISALLDFNVRDELFLSNSGSLNVSGAITGTGTLRKELSGDLALSGDNSAMTGAIQVQQGTLTGRSSNAFGSTAGGVKVVSGTTLVLDGNFSVGNETLDLIGSTGTALGSIVDTLRITPGSNVTWGTGTTTVNFSGTNNFINTVGTGVLAFNASLAQTNSVFKLGFWRTDLSRHCQQRQCTHERQRGHTHPR